MTERENFSPVLTNQALEFRRVVEVRPVWPGAGTTMTRAQPRPPSS